MKVPVHKIVGDVCTTYKDGERLQGEFREAFDRGDTVELDFDKMRIYVTAFFNAAVASLLENYSRSELERRLKIVNLPSAAKRAVGLLARQRGSLLSRSKFPGSGRRQSRSGARCSPRLRRSPNSNRLSRGYRRDVWKLQLEWSNHRINACKGWLKVNAKRFSQEWRSRRNESIVVES